MSSTIMYSATAAIAIAALASIVTFFTALSRGSVKLAACPKYSFTTVRTLSSSYNTENKSSREGSSGREKAPTSRMNFLSLAVSRPRSSRFEHIPRLLVCKLLRQSDVTRPSRVASIFSKVARVAMDWQTGP